MHVPRQEAFASKLPSTAALRSVSRRARAEAHHRLRRTAAIASGQVVTCTGAVRLTSSPRIVRAVTARCHHKRNLATRRGSGDREDHHTIGSRHAALACSMLLLEVVIYIGRKTALDAGYFPSANARRMHFAAARTLDGAAT
jgi:hypothetical protein